MDYIFHIKPTTKSPKLKTDHKTTPNWVLFPNPQSLRFPQTELFFSSKLTLSLRKTLAFHPIFPPNNHVWFFFGFSLKLSGFFPQNSKKNTWLHANVPHQCCSPARRASARPPAASRPAGAAAASDRGKVKPNKSRWDAHGPSLQCGLG